MRRASLLAAGAATLLAAPSGCGGSGKDAAPSLRATCTQQQAALTRVGTPVGLQQAEHGLRAVIAMDRSLLATRPDAALAAQIHRLDQNARRGLARIQSDPEGSMSPLRTGAADGRRVAGAARALLARACPTQNG